MIQRIQTVYFIAIILIAAVSCGGELLSNHQNIPDVVNVGKYMVKDYTLNSVYFNVSENGNLVTSEIQYGLILLISLIIGWTINIILGFKNRVKQIRNTKINFLFISLYILALFTTAFTKIPDFSFSQLSIKSTFGVALMIFMIYLNFRALILIRKDEELVKSADRIR